MCVYVYVLIDLCICVLRSICRHKLNAMNMFRQSFIDIMVLDWSADSCLIQSTDSSYELL